MSKASVATEDHALSTHADHDTISLYSRHEQNVIRL